MIQDTSLKLLQQRFAVKVLDSSLARCERRHGAALVSVHYFVFGDGCLAEPFDLKGFQDKWIANDYYTNPGHLQWNYYLVFVVSQDAVKAAGFESKRRRIEQDRFYTRKYVVSSSELEPFLVGGVAAPAREAGESADDILDRWTEKLDEAGLSVVYGDAGKSHVVSGIVEGTRDNVVPHDQEDQEAEAEDVPGQIQELTIRRFRVHPKTTGALRFGRFNLISGPNGVGKTSLLEALELMYCGVNRRNSTVDAQADLGAIFQGLAGEDRFDAGALQKYKRWNQHWYGRASHRRGALANNFARHNFFDTDAAFRMTDQEKDEPLKEALAALALGERVNFLEKRLETIREELRQRQQQLQTQIGARERTAKEREEVIAQASAVPAKSATLFKLLVARLAEAGIPNVTEDGVASAHQLVLRIRDGLGEVTGSLPWLERITSTAIRTEFRKTSELLASVHQAETALSAIRVKIRSSEAEATKQESQIAVLESAAPYVKLAPGELDGLERSIRTGQENMQRLERASSMLERLDLGWLSSVRWASTLAAELDSRAAKVAEIAKEHKRRADLEAKLSQQVAELDRVLAEIRSLGGRYVKLSPKSSTCPMCGHVYDAGGLRERVEAHSVQTHVSSDLQKLQDERRATEIALKSAREEYALIEGLDEAISAARGVDSVRNQSPVELLKDANNLPIALKAARDVLADGIRRMNELEAVGVSPRGRASMNARIGAILPGVTLDVSGQAALTAGIAERRQAYESAVKARELEEAKAEEAARRLERQLAESLSAEGSLEDLRETCRERHRLLERALSIVVDIGKAMALEEDADCRGTLKAIGQVDANISEYLKARKDERERSILVESAKKELQVARQEIEELRPKAERCEKAYSVIDEILRVDSKEAGLRTFLNANFDNIARIFRSIHAPREFTALHPERLSLIRESGEEATLSHISTGQRAALALSVFISLNFLLRRGPPVILIDDPVAHVDDLNALSFLDFLRNAVIELDRQVFFSTASTKLAELCRRKFGFLGAEFVECRLER